MLITAVQHQLSTALILLSAAIRQSALPEVLLKLRASYTKLCDALRC